MNKYLNHAGIIEVYLSGETLASTGKSLGVSTSYVLKVLIKNDIPRRSQGTNNQHLLDGRDQKMVALYDSGQTLDEIAEVYNISRERVRQVIKKISGPRTTKTHNSAASVREKKARILVSMTELAAKGLTPAEASIELGMHYGTLLAKARQLGVVFKSPYEAAHAKNAQAAKLYLDGHKIRDIAVALGDKFPENVFLRLKKAGVSTNRNKRRTTGNKTHMQPPRAKSAAR